MGEESLRQLVPGIPAREIKIRPRVYLENFAALVDALNAEVWKKTERSFEEGLRKIDEFEVRTLPEACFKVVAAINYFIENSVLEKSFSTEFKQSLKEHMDVLVAQEIQHTQASHVISGSAVTRIADLTGSPKNERVLAMTKRIDRSELSDKFSQWKEQLLAQFQEFEKILFADDVVEAFGKRKIYSNGMKVILGDFYELLNEIDKLFINHVAEGGDITTVLNTLFGKLESRLRCLTETTLVFSETARHGDSIILYGLLTVLKISLCDYEIIPRLEAFNKKEFDNPAQGLEEFNQIDLELKTKVVENAKAILSAELASAKREFAEINLLLIVPKHRFDILVSLRKVIEEGEKLFPDKANTDLLDQISLSFSLKSGSAFQIEKEYHDLSNACKEQEERIRLIGLQLGSLDERDPIKAYNFAVNLVGSKKLRSIRKGDFSLEDSTEFYAVEDRFNKKKAELERLRDGENNPKSGRTSSPPLEVFNQNYDDFDQAIKLAEKLTEGQKIIFDNGLEVTRTKDVFIISLKADSGLMLYSDSFQFDNVDFGIIYIVSKDFLKKYPGNQKVISIISNLEVGEQIIYENGLEINRVSDNENQNATFSLAFRPNGELKYSSTISVDKLTESFLSKILAGKLVDDFDFGEGF